MATPNSLNMISNTDILKLDTDTLIRVWAWEEYPLLAMLHGAAAHGTDAIDYWLNSAEGINSTLLDMSSPAMSGGAAFEKITVDSTADFVTGHVVRFQENTGSSAGQAVYISSIDSATEMTVVTFSGNLAAHADNTKIVLVGDRTKYGDTLDQKFRLPTRSSNTIEQISVTGDLPFNMLDTSLTNGQSIEDVLTADAVSQFKQKLTAAALTGTERVAATSGGYGAMAGLASLVNSDNIGSGGFTRALFRTWLSELKVRGAFAGNKGTLMVNDKALALMYAFDDANVGISWRETDKFLGEIRILGIPFTIFVEPMMNDLFISDKPRVFALTPSVKKQPALRLAYKAKARSNGQPRQVLETSVAYSLQIARFATLELLDPYRHGFYKGT